MSTLHEKKQQSPLYSLDPQKVLEAVGFSASGPDALGFVEGCIGLYADDRYDFGTDISNDDIRSEFVPWVVPENPATVRRVLEQLSLTHATMSPEEMQRQLLGTIALGVLVTIRDQFDR